MDFRNKGTQLLIAGGLFTLAGLNTWRLSGGETGITIFAGILVLGGVICLATGGYFLSQDQF